MKNLFLMLVLLFTITFVKAQTPSTTTLTFTLANAQVVNNGNDFRFDVQMHADAAGTSHFLGTIYLIYNTNAFGSNISNNIDVQKLSLLNEEFFGSDKYNIINIVDNNPSTIAITWEGAFGALSPSPTFHTEVPLNTPTGLMQITIPIVDGSELAGSEFNQTLMNGQQFGIIAANTNEAYENPNIYANDLTSQPFPVELTHFQAKLLPNQTTQLDWQTATELNNQGFEVERSQDARNWEAIGFVKGQGTTTELQDYRHIDPQPYTGINYYRLRQIDFDGGYEYSPVRSVRVESGQGQGIRVYPNPFREGELNVNFTTALVGSGAALRIFDINGQALRQVALTGQHNAVPIGQLPAGVYLLEVADGREVWRERLVVQ